MKIAVIGAGYFGKNHVRDLKKLGHNVTVCDLDQKNLDYCWQNFQVDATTTKLKDILDDKSITAATICLPNNLHFPVAKKLLQKGKNILVEKPMTLKSSDSKKLIQLASKKKLVLNVGHIFRFNPTVIKLKELLEKKELGHIRLVKFTWTNLDPIYPDRDIISDLGVHAFDVFNFLFEKNPKIISSTGKTYRKKEGVEIAFVSASLGNILAFFELSWLTPGKKRDLIVVGEKNTVTVNLISQSISIVDNNTLQTEEIHIQQTNPLMEELNHFVDCIEKKIRSKANGKIGLEIVEVIEEAQKKLK